MKKIFILVLLCLSQNVVCMISSLSDIELKQSATHKLLAELVAQQKATNRILRKIAKRIKMSNENSDALWTFVVKTNVNDLKKRIKKEKSSNLKTKMRKQQTSSAHDQK